MSKLFQIGAKLRKRSILFIEISGLIFFLSIWMLITYPGSTGTLQLTCFSSHELNYTLKNSSGYEKHFAGNTTLDSIPNGEYNLVIRLGEKTELEKTISIISGFSFPQEDTVKHEKIVVHLKTESSNFGIVEKQIFPNPSYVLHSYKRLFKEKERIEFSSVSMQVSSLIFHASYSILLNFSGYALAIGISLIVGFIIALVPFFRALLSRYIDAIRFVPLAAVTGLFIAWFGIEFGMKVQFLAFGIFVFLLPVVVQRIGEVDKVYLQTAYTLGASQWQLIRYVYWPHVISKIIDDIRVLTAISWTYIIVAETINAESGLGKLIFNARRRSRLDEVFAVLFIIILVGIMQDYLFTKIDKKVNPHKYE